MKRNVGLHRLWKEAVIAMRGTTCESCGESEATTVIEAHHVAQVIDHPELAYSPENGAILCCRCHAHLHSGRKDLIDKVNAAVEKADPARAAWISAHAGTSCPDYDDPVVVEAIRKALHACIPAELETCYKRYYRKNKTTVNDRNKAYAQAHREELKAYKHAYYLAHKEETNARSRRYYLDHKEECLAQCKAHYELQKAKKKEWSDEYRRKHRAEKLERERQYRATHQDVIRKWRADHRDELAAKERERRRLKRITKQTTALPMEEPT